MKTKTGLKRLPESTLKSRHTVFHLLRPASARVLGQTLKCIAAFRERSSMNSVEIKSIVKVYLVEVECQTTQIIVNGDFDNNPASGCADPVN